MFLEANSGNSYEMLDVRAGEILLARIHGSIVIVRSRVVDAPTFPEAFAKATGCTLEEAKAAISEYSEA